MIDLKYHNVPWNTIKNIPIVFLSVDEYPEHSHLILYLKSDYTDLTIKCRPGYIYKATYILSYSPNTKYTYSYNHFLKFADFVPFKLASTSIITV